MNAATTFPPTRTAALERLARFVPKAGRAYAAGRNFDLGTGQHAAVSTLSPYLRTRLITETEVLQAVLGRHSPEAAEKFIQEVFWRTYWKGWLEQRPGVWVQYRQGVKTQLDAVQTQSGLRARWEAACLGQTDIECFNHWAQELVSTGYLHNHARMWFASIWIFTLRLPWELGADFFLRHLLDGDPASNTLGWRWVAGLQTVGKTYLARADNIATFTEGRFNPVGQLAPDAPPLPPLPLPDPQPLAELPTLEGSRRSGFLLHGEDLCPGFALEGLNPVAFCRVAPPQTLSPLSLSPLMVRFNEAALADAAERWTARMGADHGTVQTAQNIADWAGKEQLEQIVAPYAPAGPVADLLRAFETLPGTPPLVRVRRRYDSTCWPYATKGFFAFKRQIPDFLKSLI